MDIFKYGQKEMDYLRKKDKRLAEAIDRIGFIERRIIPDLFACLVNSIIGQQISIKAADTIWKRLQEIAGEITVESILALSPEELKACGITMRKVFYIRDAAEKIRDGRFDIGALYDLPDDEVCKRLASLNGVGAWTAEMLMINSMQRPDIVSWNDLGIRRGMMMLYHHKKLDRAMFEKYRRRYSPYGSVASFYLWKVAVGY
ncbi:MAG TPA: DNA-3-methyladenine glycosylase 2 family protein [Candidatus Atribacteria bacterium]|nr:DNA-3-methyladenine glycosylase 2 family protein [Candidatus Atribacteria bacterium]